MSDFTLRLSQWWMHAGSPTPYGSADFQLGEENGDVTLKCKVSWALREDTTVLISAMH